MHKRDGALVYSASDLVDFLECAHRTTLDLINLGIEVLAIGGVILLSKSGQAFKPVHFFFPVFNGNHASRRFRLIVAPTGAGAI